MLTDSVQISYAQTEGYVPVTTKAQASTQYQDYLSRRGEDNDLYYDIKIAATRLLLDNTENTFVTPVFNGSASLRNAAGQLVENVTKTVLRKKELNYQKLYEDVSALYRLDQIEVKEKPGDKEFGPLPAKSVALLVSLGACWVFMGCYVGVNRIKNRKKM